MKKPSKKPAKSKPIYDQLGPGHLHLLKQILSPLELAAMQHSYQPFRFKIGGKFVYFSSHAAKELLDATSERAQFVNNRLWIEEGSAKVPYQLREAFEDPREVMSLRPYVRNRLHTLQCYTMFRIMIRGRKYFEERTEFGPKSMKEIIELFEKHGCPELF